MILDSVISLGFCNELIAKFDAQDKNSVDLTIDEIFSEDCLDLYKLNLDLVEFYKDKCEFSAFPDKFGYSEIQMKKYELNQGATSEWNTDVKDKESANRFLTIHFFLNDVEEGGQLEFLDKEKDLKVNARRGRIVVFPSMWLFPHKELPPISNSKYVLSTYCHYI
jgi:hypothetical protein